MPSRLLLRPTHVEICIRMTAQFFKNTDFSMHADDYQVNVSDNSIEAVQEKLDTWRKCILVVQEGEAREGKTIETNIM